MKPVPLFLRKLSLALLSGLLLAAVCSCSSPSEHNGKLSNADQSGTQITAPVSTHDRKLKNYRSGFRNDADFMQLYEKTPGRKTMPCRQLPKRR